MIKPKPRSKDVNTIDLSILGGNIGGLREQKTMSLQEYASKLKYDRTRLSYLEGGIQNIHLSTLIRIAKAVDRSPSMLLNPNFQNYEESGNSECFVEYDYLDTFIKNIDAAVLAAGKKKDSVFTQREKAWRILKKKVPDPMLLSLSEMAHDLGKQLYELLKPNKEEQ